MSEFVMADATKASQPFWEKPLSELDRGQWEALCDGCGRCCLHKLEDEETGLLYPTNVACALLDRRNGRCTDYAHRKSRVVDCVVLDRSSVGKLDWLPESCAYRLRSEDKPLPGWHYLISGSQSSLPTLFRSSTTQSTTRLLRCA